MDVTNNNNSLDVIDSDMVGVCVFMSMSLYLSNTYSVPYREFLLSKDVVDFSVNKLKDKSSRKVADKFENFISQLSGFVARRSKVLSLNRGGFNYQNIDRQYFNKALLAYNAILEAEIKKQPSSDHLISMKITQSQTGIEDIIKNHWPSDETLTEEKAKSELLNLIVGLLHGDYSLEPALDGVAIIKEKMNIFEALVGNQSNSDGLVVPRSALASKNFNMATWIFANYYDWVKLAIIYFYTATGISPPSTPDVAFVQKNITKLDVLSEQQSLNKLGSYFDLFAPLTAIPRLYDMIFDAIYCQDSDLYSKIALTNVKIQTKLNIYNDIYDLPEYITDGSRLAFQSGVANTDYIDKVMQKYIKWYGVVDNVVLRTIANYMVSYIAKNKALKEGGPNVRNVLYNFTTYIEATHKKSNSQKKKSLGVIKEAIDILKNKIEIEVNATEIDFMFMNLLFTWVSPRKQSFLDRNDPYYGRNENFKIKNYFSDSSPLIMDGLTEDVNYYFNYNAFDGLGWFYVYRRAMSASNIMTLFYVEQETSRDMVNNLTIKHYKTRKKEASKEDLENCQKYFMTVNEVLMVSFFTHIMSEKNKNYINPDMASARHLSTNPKSALKTIYNILDIANPSEKIQARNASVINILCESLKTESELPNSRDILKLKETHPNFSEVIDYYAGHLELFKLTGILNIKPVLLLGSPGVGKTTFANDLAATFKIGCSFIACQTLTASWLLSGSSSQWESAKPGELANIMVGSENISKVVVFDEVDKMGTDSRYPAIAPLYSLMEQSTAEIFKDEFYEVDFDFSKFIYICTANDKYKIAEPILSRQVIFEIAPPTKSEIRKIACDMYKKIIGDSSVFADLTDEVLDTFAGMSLRDVKKSLENMVIKTVVRNIEVDEQSQAEKSDNKQLKLELDASDLYKENKTKIGF